MIWLVAFVASLPYADRLADKVSADRAAARKHAKDIAAKGGQT